MNEVTTRIVGEDAADVVFDVIQEAFGNRPRLDPPADALGEDVEAVRARLASGFGMVAEIGDHVVGAVLVERQGELAWLRRFGIRPAVQHHGVGAILCRAALSALAGTTVAVMAREELPAGVKFWTDVGFWEVRRESPHLELHHAPWEAYTAGSADETRSNGHALASRLRAGDVVVLNGPLGAGKTTFTQGIAEGLDVRGTATSPTFVISRIHPNNGDGPNLVHVDAYRLGDRAELDDLDLDSHLDRAVTVIEWGHGLAEELSESRLDITITRPEAGEERMITVQPVGPRWARR